MTAWYTASFDTGVALCDPPASTPLFREGEFGESGQPAAAVEAEAHLAEVAAQLAIAEAEFDRDISACEFAAQVAEAEAVRDLAYDLQRARLEQALIRERVGIARAEREERIEVEELEIRRKEKELVHSVHRPADAEHYRVETLAEAESSRVRLLAEADAEAIRLRGLAQAEVIRAIGLAEAEVIRQKAFAEAEGIRARLLAEAEDMRHKAAASETYPGPVISRVPIELSGHQHGRGSVEGFVQANGTWPTPIETWYNKLKPGAPAVVRTVGSSDALLTVAAGVCYDRVS